MDGCAGAVMGLRRIPTLAKNARVGQPQSLIRRGKQKGGPAPHPAWNPTLQKTKGGAAGVHPWSPRKPTRERAWNPTLQKTKGGAAGILLNTRPPTSPL